MRKPAIILLLLCFLFQTGGLWLLLYFRQMEQKQEMKAKLRADPDQFDQTIFEFKLAKGEVISPSFEWEEDNEFRYNGSMYDVIEKKVTGNVLYVRCVDDEKEAGIIKQMEELQKKEQGSNKSQATSFQQLISLLLFYQHNSSEHTTQVFSVNHTDHYSENSCLITIDVISPPPRGVNSITNC